jgi:hypothetical protein
MEAAVHYYLCVGSEPDRDCIAHNAHLYPNARGIRQLLKLIDVERLPEMLRIAVEMSTEGFRAAGDQAIADILNGRRGLSPQSPQAWRRALTP